MMLSKYQAFLDERHHTKNYRTLPQRLLGIDYTSNDYLQLSKHPDVVKATQNALLDYGLGAKGSRLLAGNYPLIEEFERKIAKDCRQHGALIYASGFQANASTLAALLDEKILGQKPVVFFDKYNHASLYAALKLSPATVHRYQHGDMAHLEFLLKQYGQTKSPKFIVSETVFSMDGDMANLNILKQFSTQYGCMLYLDEAHALGLLGQSGYGLSTDYAWSNIDLIVAGTLSKAIGAMGGYIVCNDIIKSYLVQKSQGFVYSTALSPVIIGGALKSWELIETMEDARNTIKTNSQMLREGLNALGYNTANSSTHIIPIIFSNSIDMFHVQHQLRAEGIITALIRPPTVPKHSPRLRVAIHAGIQSQDIQHFLAVMKAC